MMNDIVITNIELDAPFSTNYRTKKFYTHTRGKTEYDTFTHRISGQKKPFLDVLIYAITHETLHLVLDKIGEDGDILHTYFVTEWIYWVLGMGIDLSSIKQIKRTEIDE